MHFLLATLLLVLPTLAPADTSPPPKPLKEGLRVYVEQVRAPFPNIGFYDAMGKKVRLNTSNGTLRLVNFWASWCTPCIEELPALQTLQQKYPTTLRVLTVNEDIKGFDVITPFIKEHHLEGMQHYHDKDQVEYTKLQMQGLPMSFLIDKDGSLIATIEGKIDWLGADMAGLLKRSSAAPQSSR
jgi:thiol-disulfide isomerase/thioredoxin